MLTAKLSSINNAITTAIQAALIILWVYAATSKMLDFDQSRSEMLGQVFPAALSEFLAWAVPLTELGAAGLLIFSKTRRIGLYLSLLLLFVFSIYIITILLNVFGRIPCSCGGILENMTWTEHLLFNVFFIVLTLIALIQTSEDGRAMGKAV
jgi:putative oxidoreductase